MSLVFKFKASMTSSICLPRPCNFGVSQCIKSKFSDMGYFDLFSSKMVFVFKFIMMSYGKHGKPCNFGIFQDRK